MNTLIATVGLPRAGKSSWARAQSFPIVNPDSIRMGLHAHAFVPEAEEFVWAIAKVMVRALFLAGHETVILDATNTTRKRRDEWKSYKWSLQFKVFDTSEEECRQRALSENDGSKMDAIKRMAAAFESLQPDEKVWTPIEVSNG